MGSSPLTTLLLHQTANNKLITPKALNSMLSSKSILCFECETSPHFTEFFSVRYRLGEKSFSDELSCSHFYIPQTPSHRKLFIILGVSQFEKCLNQSTKNKLVSNEKVHTLLKVTVNIV